LELAGYENMLSKIVGSNNKLNNALTTIKALTSYKHAAHFNKMIAEPVEAEEEIEEETPAVKEGEVLVEKGKVIEA
jgi:ribosomal protein S5